MNSNTSSSAHTLTGKVALVTGGSRGLGAAIARRLAAEGAAVVITYSASPAKAQEVVRDIEAAGGRALAVHADAAKPAAVRAAVTQTVAAFGGIDILVNNAGVFAMASIEQFGDEDYDRLIAVNITGVFAATQEASRHLRDGGRIIHIGSVNSDAVPFTGGSVYALTKGAIASFTKGLARDLGPRGITVNNVQPGPVNTDMNPDSGEFADYARGLTALKRYGQPGEIASFVAYLASPEAGFITGANLLADGGFAA